MSTTYIYRMKITGKQCISAQASVAGGFVQHEEALCMQLSGASLSASEDVNHEELSAPSHCKWKAIHHWIIL